jgi:hypothetical protein
LLFQALSILGIVFGSLLVDRPERFAGHKLRENIEEENAEERQIVLEGLESEKEDNIVANLTVSSNDVTANYSSGEIHSNDEDILESLDEYSEENFEYFTNGEIDEETNYDDILKEDIEVEEALEEVEPSPEIKNYQKIIKYIKNEGIEGKS